MSFLALIVLIASLKSSLISSRKGFPDKCKLSRLIAFLRFEQISSNILGVKPVFERSRWRNFLLYLSIATIYSADSSWRSIYSYSLSSVDWTFGGFELSGIISASFVGAFRKSLISFQDKFISSSRLFLERHSRMGLNPVALSSYEDISRASSAIYYYQGI